MSSHESTHFCDEQLLLPLAIRPEQEVYWFNATTEQRRKYLLGKQTVSRLVIEPGGAFAATTTVSVDAIAKFTDPQLRYALRMQNAADAAGMYQHSSESSSGHYVSVDATDAGLDAQFIGATYTGITVGGVDTFMENLRRFAPDYDGTYGDL